MKKTWTDNQKDAVSERETAKPFVISNHIDGPVLVRRDGQMVWLNWRERIAYAFGLVTAEQLEVRINPRRL